MSDEPVEEDASGSDAGEGSATGSDDPHAEDGPAASDGDAEPAPADETGAEDSDDSEEADATADDSGETSAGPRDDPWEFPPSFPSLESDDRDGVATGDGDGAGADGTGSTDDAVGPESAADADDETAAADVDADETAAADVDADEAEPSPEDPEWEPRDAAPADDEASDGETDRPVATHAPVGGEVPSAASTAGDGGVTGSIGGGILGTPPDDEEMPLTEHIQEMLTRLAIVVVVAGLATLAVFPFADDIIVRMWYDVHPGGVGDCLTAPQGEGCVPPHVYGPLELVLARIRVAALAGLVVALPLAVYQVYLFMRPGLYPHERRYYLAAVPFSLVLAVVGMVFAYFVLLPLLFTYFTSYSEGSAELAFQLADTMNLIIVMMGMLAVVFQIPLLIMLAIMMGLVTRRWLERRRIYFWGFFLGFGFLFGPDPTGMAPVLLTATMVVLFEATLLLLRWTGR